MKHNFVWTHDQDHFEPTDPGIEEQKQITFEEFEYPYSSEYEMEKENKESGQGIIVFLLACIAIFFLVLVIIWIIATSAGLIESSLIEFIFGAITP